MGRLRERRGLAGGLLAVALLPLPAFGATYSVPGDFATIQEAIRGAGDHGTILVAPGVYHEFIIARAVNKDLHLVATGGPANTAIDGQGTNRLLQVNRAETGDPAKNLVFEGFTFRNGWSDTSSPVAVWDTRPTFVDCVFTDNVSTSWGGAVVVNGVDAAPSFVNCEFRNNRCASAVPGRGGGAVLVTGGHAQASFRGCRFEDNTAEGGPYTEGGALSFSTAGGVVEDCVFSGNRADYAGGAIMVLNPFGEAPEQVAVTGSRFEGNGCAPHRPARPEPSEGGAVMAEGNVTVAVTGCSFSANVAESGGAIQSYRANLAVADSVFEANVASGTGGLGSGGAIGVSLDDAGDADRREAAVSIRRAMFRGNEAPSGGALAFAGDLAHGTASLVRLEDVTVDGSLATAAGAGSGNAGGMTLNLAAVEGVRVFLLRNTADGLGGAVALVNGSSLTLADSVVAGNTAAVDPAIHNPGGLPVTLTGTIVAHNGGDGAAAAAVLAATPAVTVHGRAHLAYFVAPYPAGLQLEPAGIPLPNEAPGGTTYAAGSVAVDGVGATTTFGLSASPGPTATVSVRQAPAVDLGVRGHRGLRRGFFLYDLGSRVRVLGSVSPAQETGEVRVRFERRTPGGWVPVALRTRPLGPEGAYRLRWRPRRPGKYRISTSFAGDAVAAPGQSEPCYVRVRR